MKASLTRDHVVLVLETRDGDQLVARLARLDDVNAAPAGPLLRVLDYHPAGVSLNWTTIARLRAKALRSLALLAERLEDCATACVDVSGAARATDVAGVALAASVAVETPATLVEVVAPALIGAWRSLLDESRLSTTPRRVRRRRPLAPETDDELALAALASEHPSALLDSESVGRLISGNPEHKSPKVRAARARRQRKIYGIWDGANAYLYPAFQFRSDGKPHPEAGALAAALAGGDPPAAWWFEIHPELGGVSPAEAFAGQPEVVIALATQVAKGYVDE